MSEKIFHLVTECTIEYSVKDLREGGVEILIQAPKKFRWLWVSKLSDLSTTEKEIKEYEYK